ncbi:MAG: peptide chain release factor N(5)-glutamine methyltransferase [Acidobacteriota bacterium]|nr:MAG: peptide chain release factor N(5)-glutamine methyltransferase [Acidobacteriota bacterium]
MKREKMNVAEGLDLATKRLAAAGVANERREAVSLMMHAIGKDRTFLYAHREYVLSDADENNFSDFLERRANREPLQYIIGVQEFYGLEFEVTPDVLIPRPETELLAEQGLEIMESVPDDPRFLEIGVGSGCISVSILKHVPNARAVAVDISRAAIAVAERNAVRHGVRDRITLIQSDVYENVEGKFHLIVSNPPYIPDEDIADLMKEVRGFEPPPALAGGSDGLSIMRRIIDGAPDHLHEGGAILLEVGAGQAGAVALLLDRSLFAFVQVQNDLAGIGRMVGALLKRKTKDKKQPFVCGGAAHFRSDRRSEPLTDEDYERICNELNELHGHNS